MPRISLKVYGLWSMVFGLAFFQACQSAPHQRLGTGHETTAEVIQSVGTMTEGLTNAPVSQEDLKRLAHQMRQDPGARRAVESVNNALQVRQVGIKYCPMDGKRFSQEVKQCPKCGTLLKDLE